MLAITSRYNSTRSLQLRHRFDNAKFLPINYKVIAIVFLAAVGEVCDSSQSGKIMRGDSRQKFHHLECRSAANQSKRAIPYT